MVGLVFELVPLVVMFVVAVVATVPDCLHDTHIHRCEQVVV